MDTMKLSLLVVLFVACLWPAGQACMVGGYWRFGPSYYDDYDLGPSGMRMSSSFGFGPSFGPGYFGSGLGFGGMRSLWFLLGLLLGNNRPQQTVHHHHHYYHKPGGGYDYKYSKEGPKEDHTYDKGGGYDYKYRKEAPKDDHFYEKGGGYEKYGQDHPSAGGYRSRSDPRGSGTGFYSFFKNMFYK